MTLFSKSTTLITNPDIPKISGGNPEGTTWAKEMIDTWAVRTLDTSQMDVDTEAWSLTVASKVIDKSAKEVDNILMMIRYVFVD
jgi:hypothetical protein